MSVWYYIRVQVIPDSAIGAINLIENYEKRLKFMVNKVQLALIITFIILNK